MVKIRQYNTKSLYFPDRITAAMGRIFDYPLTIVEAPMGYGKTTAVKEYLNRSDAYVLWQMVYDNSLSSFWKGLCRCFVKLNEDCSQSLVQLGFPGDSALRREALKIIEAIELPAKTVLVIDDYHLIKSTEADQLIEFLVLNEITNLHIVLIARFTELQSHEELKLKGYLHHIAQETFELAPKEIAEYYQLCGIKLGDAEADKLYVLTEGWISALYLLMLNFIAEGSYLYSDNIYKLVEKAVYSRFSNEIKDFLLTMCIFDSFTPEQAAYMWGGENSGKLLTEITSKNAFVKCDPKTKIYQAHNIFTNFLKSIFARKDPSYRQKVYQKAARWFLKTGDYPAAMHYFYKNADFDNILLALEADKAVSFNGENKELLITYLEECPEEGKAEHPYALLIYAMHLFTYNKMELFGKVCGEFSRIMAMDQSLNHELRRRLLGEFELLLSFTGYNNIKKMSEHHRKACELLDQPTSIYDTETNWTFGSPSVLYMFYRESGKLEEHVGDIIEALPYYYRLTNGHGRGAEYVMEAERHFNIGEFENAANSIKKALFETPENLETGIVLCIEFLRMRLALMKGDIPLMLELLHKMRSEMSSKKEYHYLHTVEICEGFIYSYLNQKNKIPERLVSGNLNHTRLMFPAYAALNIVHGRILLINGEYLKLIGSAEQFIGIAAVFSNLLGYIYIYIYLAAAYQQISRKDEALSALKQALDIAMPDRMYMPFAENCDYIKPLLEQLYREGLYREDIPRILELAAAYLEAAAAIKGHLIGEKPELTKRELEIAQLAAAGLTNKAIGARLFISENTVKTQLKSAFEKLGVKSRVLLKQALQRLS